MDKILLGNVFCQYITSLGLMEDAAQVFVGKFQTVGELLGSLHEPDLQKWVTDWLERRTQGELTLYELLTMDNKLRKVRNLLAHERIHPKDAVEAIQQQKNQVVIRLCKKMLLYLFPDEDFEAEFFKAQSQGMTFICYFFTFKPLVSYLFNLECSLCAA